MPNSVYSMGSELSDLYDDNAYCVFLNVVEGVGFNLKDNIGDFNRDKVILYATLNNIKFEIEGQSLSKESATIFNNCCIWETEMDVIKRMKTDNRPVKIECFLRPGNNNLSGSKSIGTLLLPIRGLTPINTLRNFQIKMHWHKLGTLSPEWRATKPEIYLLLIIVKKHIVESGQLELLLGKGKKPEQSHLFSDSHTETGFMLHSQSNVYVQLLEHIGAIQIGNNPELDCDIFNVTLTFKQVRNIEKLFVLESEGGSNNHQHHTDVFVFSYDILGKPTQMEILINRFDCYAINDKITLSFKSSMRSLRSYFQRIFYLPINLYYRGIAIASYRMDFNKLLPGEHCVDLSKVYTKTGTFFFDRLHKALSPRTPKPSVSYMFSIQQMTFNAKHNQNVRAIAETFVPYKSSDIPDIDLEKLKQEPSVEEKLVANKVEPIAPNESSKPNNTCSSATELRKEVATTAVQTETRTRASSLPPVAATTKATQSDISTKPEENCPNATEQKEKNNALHVAEKEEEQLPVAIEKEDSQQESKNVEAAPAAKPTEAETEAIIYNIVQELEEWKTREMQNFSQTLKRKEQQYLMNIKRSWEQERAVLRARLEAKIAKCDELNARLEKTNSELQANALKSQENFNLAEKVKQEIEATNATKFQMLEQQIEHLKVEVLQKDAIFEIKQKELQFENKKLENEKLDMSKRLLDMDKQIADLRHTQRETEELRKVIDQMREQVAELDELEKSKNYYKRKWTKTEHEVKKLRVKILEQQEELQIQRSDKENEYDCNKCLQEILSEEKDALDSDRSELRNIKEALLTAGSSSNPTSDDSVYEEE